MKYLAKTIIFSLFLSCSVWAQSLNCDIQEFFEAKTIDQSVSVSIKADDPHGSMEFFKLKKFTQYEGFIAFVKDFAVINLQTHDGSYGFSSQGNVAKGEFASLQVLVPSTDTNPAGIIIQCNLKK